MKLHTLQKHITNPVLITNERMIAYLINQSFHVGERFLGLLVEKDSATLFLNRLFPYVNEEINIVRFDDTDDVVALLSSYVVSDTIYVDAYLRSAFLIPLLQLKPQLKLVLDTQADYVRSMKSPDEIELMAQASQINDTIMEDVRNYIQLDMREIDIANFIAQCQLERGVVESFPSIVAFGDHAADPHAHPGKRRLKKDEAIIIDMGCIYHGYCSDMTRTFYLSNHIDPRYDIVLQANQQAIQAVKPGVRFKDIDRAARSVIEAAGYGSNFIHRTGHGIGQDVHEPYDVSSSNERIVEVGMVFSIEPGIYLPQDTGIRIEDLVCVTETGCRVLNSFSKNQALIHR